MKEEDIIEGCIREDRQAQEALYKRYAPRLLGLCCRYANDMLEAEDILQEGFIKVFDNISSFGGKGSFEGWLRKIMVNEALNKIRARKKNLDYMEESELEAPDFNIPIEKIQLKELLNMLALMPEGYRIVFNMFAIEGYSHQEIAEHLNISHSTSRSQYAKARNYFKKLIDEFENVKL
ncbi:MAG: RNA polymerase sigma factor [Bacteroidia bacterium]|nr:RNA polymerase sigma factor [Bacteroidia bacterium]